MAKNKKINLKNLTDESLIKLASKLRSKDKGLLDRFRPPFHGMPDMHTTKNRGESEDQFRIRRELVLKDCVENHVPFNKDGNMIRITLHPKATKFLVDMFYGYETKAILWKPRGGGGSLVVAVLMYLQMIYNHKSFTDMAGSGKQAKVVFKYVKSFFACNPRIKSAFVGARGILATKIIMYNNVEAECITASDKAVRGVHVPGFIADEACSGDATQDEIIRAGMNTVFSEKGYCVVLVSTFHLPIGLFQEFWDEAETKGFARYKWDVFDTLKTCKIGHKDGPRTYLNSEGDEVEVPLVLPGSRAEQKICDACLLTDEEPVIDNFTSKVVSMQKIGCRGRARQSQGYERFEAVCAAKRNNAGTDKFNVEFACERPETGGRVWQPELTDKLFDQKPEDIEFYEGDNHYTMRVGIDWGHASETSLVLLAMGDGYISILEVASFSRRRIQTIIDHILMWKEKYATNIDVYPDESHRFNNEEVAACGFHVTPVSFKKFKEVGIGNIGKHLMHKTLRGHSGLSKHFVEQIKGYRYDAVGKPAKINDHGCDALIAAMLSFPFNEHFSSPTTNLASTDTSSVILV